MTATFMVSANGSSVMLCEPVPDGAPTLVRVAVDDGIHEPIALLLDLKRAQSLKALLEQALARLGR